MEPQVKTFTLNEPTTYQIAIQAPLMNKIMQHLGTLPYTEVLADFKALDDQRTEQLENLNPEYFRARIESKQQELQLMAVRYNSLFAPPNGSVDTPTPQPQAETSQPPFETAAAADTATENSPLDLVEQPAPSAATEVSLQDTSEEQKTESSSELEPGETESSTKPHNLTE